MTTAVSGIAAAMQNLVGKFDRVIAAMTRLGPVLREIERERLRLQRAQLVAMRTWSRRRGRRKR